MSRPPSALNYFWILLLPLSWLWAGVTWLRRKLPRHPYRSKLKIICVGNIHSGGSGKTPLVIALAEHLQNKNPCMLARGYKGKLSAKGALVERSSKDGAHWYGDEPWMIAQKTSYPMYVGKHRASMLKKIELAQPRSLVIMDDGFQHLAVKRDVDLVVINTAKNIDEAYCLPLGELREPLCALRVANAIILIGSDGERKPAWEKLLQAVAPTVPVFSVRVRSTGIWQAAKPASFEARLRWGAFCGIATPQSFLTSLGSVPNCIFLKAYPDHHAYCEEDFHWLQHQMKENHLDGLITTDKDYFKLAHRFTRSDALFSLRIKYEIPSAFWDFLTPYLE